MVLERDDSTRCRHRPVVLGKDPGNGRKIEVRSPPVTSDIMEIGQCCKAALSLKTRISAKKSNLGTRLTKYVGSKSQRTASHILYIATERERDRERERSRHLLLTF